MSPYATLPKAIALAVPLTLGAWGAQAADLVHTAERATDLVQTAEQGANLVETAKQAGQFNGFVRVLEAVDMVGVLNSKGPLTVFAPTDDAFDRLPAGVLDRLLAEENRDALEAIVQAHIVPDVAIMASNLLGGAVEVTTLGGGTLAIGGAEGIILLAPIEPSITEVEGQTVVQQTSIAMPVSVVVAEAPQPFARDAARTTPPGEELIGVATVVAPDLVAANGVIHGIDLLLLPPETLWSF
jgi:uncharacterized surface protein with fasciclin (FAS1) repeats